MFLVFLFLFLVFLLTSRTLLVGKLVLVWRRSLGWKGPWGDFPRHHASSTHREQPACDTGLVWVVRNWPQYLCVGIWLGPAGWHYMARWTPGHGLGINHECTLALFTSCLRKKHEAGLQPAMDLDILEGIQDLFPLGVLLMLRLVALKLSMTRPGSQGPLAACWSDVIRAHGALDDATFSVGSTWPHRHPRLRQRRPHWGLGPH